MCEEAWEFLGRGAQPQWGQGGLTLGPVMANTPFTLSGGLAQCSFLFFFFSGRAMRHEGSEFPHQGLNPGPLLWEHGVLTTGPPGQSHIQVLNEHDLQNMKRWDRYEGTTGNTGNCGRKVFLGLANRTESQEAWRDVISNVQIPFSTAANEILPLR